MARGTQLGTLVDMLRKEVGDATNAALGANAVDHYKQTLSRIQQQLFDEHDWPFKKIKRDIQLQAGVRYYAFPDDLDSDRINMVQHRNGAQWCKVDFGICEEQYNQIDSDADDRNDVIQRWDFHEDDEFEVWPIPATTGQTLPGVERNLRMRGTKKLNPLVSESDRAELDDILIVMTAAAEILTRRKAADAKDKSATAARRMVTLKAAFSKKNTFQIGGGDDYEDEKNPRILVAYAGNSSSGS